MARHSVSGRHSNTGGLFGGIRLFGKSGGAHRSDRPHLRQSQGTVGQGRSMFHPPTARASVASRTTRSSPNSGRIFGGNAFYFMR